MSLETVRKCDTFRTYKGIEEYRIRIFKVDGSTSEDTLMWWRSADLSGRGLARLKKFILRGLTPPGDPVQEEDDEARPLRRAILCRRRTTKRVGRGTTAPNGSEETKEGGTD